MNTRIGIPAALMLLSSGVAAFLGTAPPALAQAQSELNYAAKFVCRERANDIIQVVSGAYRTTVNIHNPHEITVQFLKRASQGLTQREPRGEVGPWVEEFLRPGETLGVDCTDIRRLFSPPKGGFIDGFLDVRVSPDPDTGITPFLDVVSVYTAKKRPQGGETDVDTIDIESFEPKEVLGIQQPLADLTVKLINPPTSVSCPGGTGTCTTTVDIDISELNGVAVPGNFTVNLTNNVGQSATFNVPGIAAGGTVPVSPTLGPPGSNCYSPDCTVTVTVDSGGTVAETDEGNNTDSRTDIG